jgi:hypothetical protein
MEKISFTANLLCPAAVINCVYVNYVCLTFVVLNNIEFYQLCRYLHWMAGNILQLKIRHRLIIFH